MTLEACVIFAIISCGNHNPENGFEKGTSLNAWKMKQKNF